MKIAVLYTELADYTIACLRELKAVSDDIQLLVIHYPVNNEAPFHFNLDGIGEFMEISRFSHYSQLRAKLKQFQPDKIVCSGWINKWYVRVCFELRSSSLTILALDTQWSGSLKQQTLAVISRFTLKNIFHVLWVAGPPQMEYAKKLGYPDNRIMTGVYSCDFSQFASFYRERKSARVDERNSFICVARYIPEKNYQTLWNAFIAWRDTRNGNWDLYCAGSGSGFNDRKLHPGIHHEGFVQKSQWLPLMMKASVFLLPSFAEPWGVVVHEFAAAGFPMILSNRVGASSMFLNSKNGLLVEPVCEEGWIKAFDQMSACSKEQLAEMGEESHRLASQVTPSKWAQQLLSV
jgi:glycosyltransferase involved in cell wall biosynthesis